MPLNFAVQSIFTSAADKYDEHNKLINIIFQNLFQFDWGDFGCTGVALHL